MDLSLLAMRGRREREGREEEETKASRRVQVAELRIFAGGRNNFAIRVAEPLAFMGSPQLSTAEKPRETRQRSPSQLFFFRETVRACVHARRILSLYK